MRLRRGRRVQNLFVDEPGLSNFPAWVRLVVWVEWGGRRLTVWRGRRRWLNGRQP